MRSNTRFKWFSLFLTLSLLVACTATIKPEWVTIYNHKADVQSDRLTWLEDMVVDSQGNVVVTGSAIRTNLTDREQNVLLASFNASGDRLWARDFDLATGDYRSDDDPRALAIDSSNNLYVLATQYKVIDDLGSTGSYLLSVDANGNERWRRQLSDNDDMRGLTLSNNRLYVTGDTTQVFDLNGDSLMQSEHNDHRAWSVAVDASGDFVLGGGKAVSYFNGDGSLRWQQEQPSDGTNFGEAIFAMDGSILAADARSANGSARITRFSPQGDKLWSQSFSAARQSYGLPGPALVFEDNRGDIYLITSNDAGHRIVKMDASGSIYWNKTSRKGIVQDAELKNGALYVVGGGHNAKYNSDGERIAEAETGRSVQITTGSLALDGDRIYVGYSAQQDGTFAVHLSRFNDQ